MSLLKPFIANDEQVLLRMRYPWLTLLLALILPFYTLLMLTPELRQVLAIPSFVFHPAYFSAAFLGFTLIAWWEYRRFSRLRAKARMQLHKMLGHKKELQKRAQTAASHTDKLKMFISDKLLEYIEYDEKYLHFRSIAAEVRHNGVISFDKVQSALLYASEHSLPDERGSNALLYHEALSGMRYLWDLLDLSTADNIALHIGAHVSHCEELLFQAELQGSELNTLPIAPIFDPQQALIDTLRLHLGAQLCDEDGKINPRVLYADNGNDEIIYLTDNDGLFFISLQACDALPGNANHLILLLENLLKNARYYATKRQYKSKFPPVVIHLWESQKCLCLTLYNRGPHIEEDDRTQIFQLGFSTRRARGHHGKGLGLYFVQQITQGFDGDISFDNIHNDDVTYTLRVQLINGEVKHLQVQQRMIDDDLRVSINGDEPQMQGELRFNTAVYSIEVGNDLSPVVQTIVMSKEQGQWFDGIHKSRPTWRLHRHSRKNDVFHWLPLDIRGVQFSLRIPTITGRVDGVSAHSLQEPDVNELHNRFKNPDDF